jgi:RimJ/RimL family protein N-acetyltransferase
VQEPEAVTLEGRIVRLEPLTIDHTDALAEVALAPELWRWTLNFVANTDDLRDYIATAVAEREAGKSLPFAVIEKATGKAVGSTRFGNIELAMKRLEIGWTWYGTFYQRTGVNTETKLLLLTHAFETLGMQRVELKTDALNAKSRAGIERIGAKFEGTFRKHGIAWDGHIRDTVYYSIVDDEWPSVRAALQANLSARV